jgi:hypothetical protein
VKQHIPDPFVRDAAAESFRNEFEEILEGDMDLVLFSDTHELHRKVKVPLGDVLICCGDFSMFDRNLAMIEDFNEWLGELPHRHISLLSIEITLLLLRLTPVGALCSTTPRSFITKAC